MGEIWTEMKRGGSRKLSLIDYRSPRSMPSSPVTTSRDSSRSNSPRSPVDINDLADPYSSAPSTEIFSFLAYVLQPLGFTFNFSSAVESDTALSLSVMLATFVASVVWGIMYAGLGLYVSALVAFSYTVLTVVNLLVRQRYPSFASNVQNLLLLLLPVGAHVAGGGFFGSKMVVLWSLLVPVLECSYQASPPRFCWLYMWVFALCVLGPFGCSQLQLAETSPVLLMFFNIVGPSVLIVLLLALHNLHAQAERSRFRSLLSNVLPDSIATQYVVGTGSAPIRFDLATVIFADICSFTPWMEKEDPRRLISILNLIFCSFDSIVAANNVEKIKTIGDAFMAVAGVPNGHSDPAGSACRTALQMMSAIDDVNRLVAGDKQIQIRIGISTGPLVGGVIGRCRIQYDVWGRVVNRAARIEAMATPGQMHMDATTHSLVQGRFLCHPLGGRNLKGIADSQDVYQLLPQDP